MRSLIIFVLYAFISSSAVFAEEADEDSFPRLNFSGSFRTRFEHLDNFNVKKFATKDHDQLLLTRLRLELDCIINSDTHAFVQLQDNRFFLSDLSLRDFPASCPFENRLDLRQAYLETQQLLESPFGFKFGRQAIAYGDNRVWGPGDWGNTGRFTWDAVKLYYHTAPVRLDFIAARQVKTDPRKFDGSHQDSNSYGIYATVPAVEACKLDMFYLLCHDHEKRYAGESGTGRKARHTVGTHIGGEFAERFDYTGTAAYQFGKHGKDDVCAYAAHGELGCTFDAKVKPRLHCGCCYASGDSHPADGKNETFDGLNGAVDSYYGRMNLCCWKNLIDWYAGAGIKPREGVSLTLEYHCFQLAQSKDAWYYGNGNAQRRDKSGASSRDIGDEIDFIARWKIAKNIELMAGHSLFMPGSFVRRTGKAGDASWTFAQVNVNF